MSANITSIKSHRDFLSGPALRTRKRVFDLGEHSYSGAPGLCWSTNYWIKALGKGEVLGIIRVSRAGFISP